MSRSYFVVDLVALPRLSAMTALALGTELHTVYKLQDAPPEALHKPAERLGHGVGALRASRQDAVDAPKADSGAAAAADLRLDTAWAAFFLCLQGWAKLPAEGPTAEPAEIARQFIDVLYPQGLSFTQAPYKIEWAESQARLDWLDEPANAGRVKALGAELFVAEIRGAYEGYGEALQITARRAEAKAVTVREPFENLVTALRRYVLSVSAYANEADGDPAAIALAETLLAPLAAWQSPGGRKGKGKGEPAEEPGPGDEPAPVEPVEPSWPTTD
ncbi:MAG TPA: hypothetical protein VFS43_06535 [Polyangiaceae bacterium]|nr:hypothetical protein [Polyangiaceae bacterium]